jgi:hypothetical protein
MLDKINRHVAALLLALVLAATAGPAGASPFLVSDPAPAAPGTGYEIWATVGGQSSLYLSGSAQEDGSISVELKNVPYGVHAWTARYVFGPEAAAFIPLRLQVAESCVNMKKNRKVCRKVYQLIP